MPPSRETIVAHVRSLGGADEFVDIVCQPFVDVRRAGTGRGFPSGQRSKEDVMAAVCELCGKSPSWGMSVSHSHRRTKRRWSPNIQRVRALVNGAPKRLHVCTGCIKSGKVVKAG